jgi:hypothetical protein
LTQEFRHGTRRRRSTILRPASARAEKKVHYACFPRGLNQLVPLLGRLVGLAPRQVILFAEWLYSASRVSSSLSTVPFHFPCVTLYCTTTRANELPRHPSLSFNHAIEAQCVSTGNQQTLFVRRHFAHSRTHDTSSSPINSYILSIN